MNGLEAALLLLIAFVPPTILAIRLRNAERRRREPWQSVSRAFAWGATLAATISIVLESTLDRALGGAALFPPLLPVTLVLIAPFIEEIAKALGLGVIRDDDPEPEDGYIYGGAIGLGFAATENTIYILSALLTSGQDLAMATALYRGIATVALHGAASAVAGHGVWWARYGGRPLALWTGLASAIALHVAYNALSAVALGWATLAAAALALVAYMRIMRRVRVLDESGPA